VAVMPAVEAWLRAFALARPHLFVVEMRGGTSTRLAVQRWSRERGWSLALTPRDADLLVVCGQESPGMGRAVDRVRAQVPFPREVVRLGPGECDVGPCLVEAAGRLQDWERQRREAARAVMEEAVPYRHGDLGPGVFTANLGEGPPAGLPLAERAPDRDGLMLDALHVPLGPVLPAWPAGLRLRVQLQGDVVQAAEADVEALRGLAAGPASFWDEPWRAALDGRSVTVGAAERRRAASHLDSLVRLLAVAAHRRPMLWAARLRDATLAGDDPAELRHGLQRLRRTLDRLRALDRLTDGVAVLAREEAVRIGVPGPALRACAAVDLRTSSESYPGFEPVVALGAGDSRSRWRQWLAEADQAMARAGSERTLEPVDGRLEGPRGPLEAGSAATVPTERLLVALEGMLLGEVWSNARLVAASFDPDGQQLAAALEARAAGSPEPADA
jgi:hypothetical protein